MSLKKNNLEKIENYEKEIESLQKWTLKETSNALKQRIAEVDLESITQINSIKDLKGILDFVKEIKEELNLYNDNRDNIRIHFNTFVPKFSMLHYAYNKARHKAVASSRGLGKTHNSARIWLEYLLEKDNDMTWFRYTESAVYESFVKLFQDIIRQENLKSLFKIGQNKNNGLWEIKSRVSNSVLDFRGGYSSYTLKGIEGKNKLLFDEAIEFPIEPLLKLEGNVKRKDRVELWYLFNYGEPSKYVRTSSTKLIEGLRKRGAYILKLNPEDNIYLDPEYISNLEGFKYLSTDAYHEATGKKVINDNNDNYYKPKSKLNIMSKIIKRKFTS
ncbi:hypothetical protein F0310_04600 (plasmid) [Borrelia sp. A-FGy1]|uniref:phage terminase large subunit n=1 Tax=Borrelia sp. A-FGy1 TaxID=2608247 RepID=UPI0015F4E89E|nr:phage terminase large subunit [Borrelia sp. A-FGy1]QMU99698.1 hypothetical protein F0310_04600 [Borrelia sp. A-FGy1]